jgi:hypothetical protein
MPCRHRNTSGVCDGMEIYFVLENVNKKYVIEMSSSGIVF